MARAKIGAYFISTMPQGLQIDSDPESQNQEPQAQALLYRLNGNHNVDPQNLGNAN